MKLDAFFLALCILMPCINGDFTVWDCKTLAEQGSCEFFRCMEEVYIECGETGYTLGYGYEYCTRMKNKYGSFNQEGQEWIDKLHPLMMTSLLPVYKNLRLQSPKSPAAGCDLIQEAIFRKMVDIYLDAGFCAAMEDGQNWEILGQIFGPDHFDDVIRAENREAVWDQVWDLRQACLCEWESPPVSVTKPETSNKRIMTATQGVESECTQYAHDGDCRFYECFEKRFPCGRDWLVSHVRDFELVSCREFDRNKPFMDEEGLAWLENSQKSLMESLLPLYESQTSVSCTDLHTLMFDHRPDAFLPEVCAALEHNDFALDRSMKRNSYPYTVNYHTKTIRSDILEQDVVVNWYYHRNLDTLKRLLGYLNCECHGMGLRSHKRLYELKESDQCETTPCVIKIKN